MDLSDKKNIKRILIRSTNWVGDAIMTTPAVRAIRENFPGAEIDILAKPWVASVFYNNPNIDKIILYDQKKYKGALGKIRLAKSLRRGRYDLAILLQNAFEAALLAFLAGIPRRLGFNTDGRQFLLTHPVRLLPGLKQIHETEYYLGILSGVNLAVNSSVLTLFLNNEERKQGEAIFSKYGIGKKDVVVGINPGATYGTAKRWFPERFAALCDELHRFCSPRIVIFGASGEREVGTRIAHLIQGPSVNLCGQTSLREAMALIERCQLFITNDSGLMHVAAALHIPSIAIFGSTNPVTTGPVGRQSHVLRIPLPCSPCLKPDCPTDHGCMEKISVDMVGTLAKTLLHEVCSG